MGVPISRLIITPELPANDMIISELRSAQIQLESSKIAVRVEYETISHLSKARDAINNAVDEISRGNALLGNESTRVIFPKYRPADHFLMLTPSIATDSGNNKVADAYRKAQNLAHEFRNTLQDARAINTAVRFSEEILIPRPVVRAGIGGMRSPVDSSVDGSVWGTRLIRF